MLVTEITNHVQQALQRLLYQYQQSQGFINIITALVDQIQNLEDAAFPVNNLRLLWNGTTYPAFGVQLDGIGELVGIARNGLPDDEYLIFILGTIAENFSDTTLSTMTNIVNIFFEPEQLLMFEEFPAEIGVEVAGSSLDPSLYLTVANAIQAALGAGIRLGHIATFPDTSALKFANALGGPPIVGGGGFGDASTYPNVVGGAFANVIYNNAGD